VLTKKPDVEFDYHDLRLGDEKAGHFSRASLERRSFLTSPGPCPVKQFSLVPVYFDGRFEHDETRWCRGCRLPTRCSTKLPGIGWSGARKHLNH
jgi:hypothetical protein